MGAETEEAIPKEKGASGKTRICGERRSGRPFKVQPFFFAQGTAEEEEEEKGIET